MDYDVTVVTHDIIAQCSIRPSANFGSLRCGSCLAALILLSLRRSRLILSVSAIDTIMIRGPGRTRSATSSLPCSSSLLPLPLSFVPPLPLPCTLRASGKSTPALK